jgi:hypothetical protein
MSAKSIAIGICTASFLAGAAGAGAAAAPAKASALAWMAGSWAGEKDGVHSEEHWTTPEGGALVGMHKDVKGGRMSSFEFSRIVEEGGRLCYLASPGGAAPTSFCAVEMEANRVVFENRNHDFPQRILYWREGDRIHARIEGPMNGEPVSEEWVWSRAPR